MNDATLSGNTKLAGQRRTEKSDWFDFHAAKIINKYQFKV
jgi:hypothetical protein